MEIKDIINNLKCKTNIVIIAKECAGKDLIVYEGTIYKYRRCFANSVINTMKVYEAHFINKNKVEIIFYINLRLLKDVLKRRG